MSVQERIESGVLRGAMNLPARAQRVLGGRPVRLDGLTLAAETQLMLRLQTLVREPKIEELPLPEARAALVRQARMVGGDVPIAATRDLTVDGAEGKLRARLYVPGALVSATAPASPLLMFIHGGGMMYGDLASHDAPCRFLAEQAGVRVLAIDYRLAPEHQFPVAVQDCAAAYRWVVAHAEELGADPARLAVGGDSAGGYLSATTAVTAAEEGLPLAFTAAGLPGHGLHQAVRQPAAVRRGLLLDREVHGRRDRGLLRARRRPVRPAGVGADAGHVSRRAGSGVRRDGRFRPAAGRG